MREENDGRLAVAVGVDVAKATLSVLVRYQDGTERALTLRNTETDIRKRMLPRLAGCPGRIVMESTNHYHWLTALLLTEAGLDVRVVNPILAKQYTSANIRKVKTDPQDAAGLARMASVADNLPSRFRLSRETLALRKKLSAIAAIGRELQALKGVSRQMEEARGILETEPSSAEKNLEETIERLQETRGVFEEEFVRGSAALQKDDVAATNLDTVPGVTPFVAHLVLHWFSRIPDQTAKSWIGYAGLDVSSRESGTWHGRCRLTKRGNSFLRLRLYGVAWGATMSDKTFRAYYDRLKNEGRSHVESLLIIARKIVRIMFKIVESGTAYDASKCIFGNAS